MEATELYESLMTYDEHRQVFTALSRAARILSIRQDPLAMEMTAELDAALAIVANAFRRSIGVPPPPHG